MDKLLKICGVPARYLAGGPDPTQGLRRCEYRRSWVPGGQERSITIQKQRDAINTLLTAPPDRGVVGVGARPTDDFAMGLGAALVRATLERDRRSRAVMQNLAVPLTDNRIPRVVVLHNITPGSHDVRKQICRDRILQYDQSLVVVVVGGMNPIDFFYQHLHVPLDTAIYYEGDDENL